MRLTQDDCPSVSVSRMRALGEVREDMSRVRVTIGAVSRTVGLWHMRFPNGGGWSFFLCPSCARRWAWQSSGAEGEDRAAGAAPVSDPRRRACAGVLIWVTGRSGSNS